LKDPDELLQLLDPTVLTPFVLVDEYAVLAGVPVLPNAELFTEAFVASCPFWKGVSLHVAGVTALEIDLVEFAVSGWAVKLEDLPQGGGGRFVI
jgi:hypothetical protein